MGREETKSTKNWREEDESIQLRIPVDEAPHYSRHKLLTQYVDMRVNQAKAMLKISAFAPSPSKYTEGYFIVILLPKLPSTQKTVASS